jgi:hypothetical protein
MLQTDSRYPGWVKGWGVVKGEPPGWHFAGIFETRLEALEAAEKAGEGYGVQWGSYDERNKEFVSGNS